MRLHEIRQDGQCDGLRDGVPPQAHEVCVTTCQFYVQVGYEPPWIGYLAEVEEAIVGTCAFKGPSVKSIVEIAYFTFPGFEGHGHASRMALQLIEIANTHSPGIVIKARTLPQSNASTSVLKKLGFTLRGIVEDPDDGTVWEWLLIPRENKSS